MLYPCANVARHTAHACTTAVVHGAFCTRNFLKFGFRQGQTWKTSLQGTSKRGPHVLDELEELRATACASVSDLTWGLCPRLCRQGPHFLEGATLQRLDVSFLCDTAECKAHRLHSLGQMVLLGFPIGGSCAPSFCPTDDCISATHPRSRVFLYKKNWK